MRSKEIELKICAEFERCMPLFIALGDEVRQQIVLVLICAGCEGLRVGDITEQTRLSRPAVSHHLKLLKDAKIIEIRKEGTKNYYYIGMQTSLADFCKMTSHINALISELQLQASSEIKEEKNETR